MSISVSNLGQVIDTGSDSQSNFTFASFGAEDPGRFLIALIVTRDALDFSATSITIGGVAATINADTLATGNNLNAVIATALVPTGSSGDVVVNWSEDITRDQACTLLRVTGIASATAYDVGINSEANPALTDITTSLDVEAGGLVVAVNATGGSASFTWSLANELNDSVGDNYSSTAAYEVRVSASAPLTVTATLSATTGSGSALAAASFTPGTSGAVSPPAASLAMSAVAPVVSLSAQPVRTPASPVVHLLEATPFDESVSDTLSAVPAPFGSWAFAGEPEFDVVTGGSETIYAADGWFNSLPADTPANQHYRPVLVSPFNAQISLFEGIEPAGRASVGFGEIVLHNGDGWLDDVIDLGWSGRPITLWRGVPFAARSTFTLVFTGALDGLTPDEQQVSLRLRTREALLDRPLQATLYQGSGGKEGGADLVGKRKPVAYGRLLNVPGVLIDSANLVYQISDLPVNQITAVRDKGVALAFDTDYASYALLVAAAISSGDYATCLAEGMVRLGGAPEGQVTIDCRGADNGDSPGGYPETAGTIIRRIVTTRLDTVNLVDPDDLDADSFDQLEIDQPAPIGFWDGPDSSLTVGQALDQIMASIGGWWTFTLPGKLSVAVLKAPGGDADAVLTRADIVFGPFALQGGVPSYRRLVGYQRMWAIQAQDSLAGAVTAADKLLYSTQYRYALTTDAAVLAKHRNARDVLTAGLFALQADAESEAARLQALHGVERRVVSVGVRPDNPFDAPLGGVVEIQDFNRLGLSSSKKYRLIGLVVDLASGETTWVLWG